MIKSNTAFKLKITAVIMIMVFALIIIAYSITASAEDGEPGQEPLETSEYEPVPEPEPEPIELEETDYEALILAVMEQTEAIETVGSKLAVFQLITVGAIVGIGFLTQWRPTND